MVRDRAPGPTACKVTRPELRDSIAPTQRRAEVPSIKIGEANARDPLTAEPSCKDEARE